MLVLDRKIDMVSPLLHDFSYYQQVQELDPAVIEEAKSKFPLDVGDNLAFSAKDSFWQIYKTYHCGQA